MEKLKEYILKTPAIMGLLTFIYAFILAFFLKFSGLKSMSLETAIICSAFIMPILYNNKFKKQFSKTYLLLYALTITLLYLLISSTAIFYSQEFSQRSLHNLLFNGMLIQSAVIFILIYVISDNIGKHCLKDDSKKQADLQNALPEEIRKKRKLIGYTILFILLLPWILIGLNTKHIINLGSNADFILRVVFLILIVIAVIYLKKTMRLDKEITFIENDEQNDNK